MANGNGSNGFKNIWWVIGTLVTVSVPVWIGIGSALFSHESRISKNETAVQRLDRLEIKLDRVLDALGVSNAKP